MLRSHVLFRLSFPLISLVELSIGAALGRTVDSKCKFSGSSLCAQLNLSFRIILILHGMLLAFKRQFNTSFHSIP